MTTPTVLSHSWKPRTTEEPEQEETHKDHRAQPHAGPSKIQTFCSRALSTRSSSSLIPVPSALPWGPGLPPPPGRASPPHPQPLPSGPELSVQHREPRAPHHPPQGHSAARRSGALEMAEFLQRSLCASRFTDSASSHRTPEIPDVCSRAN